MDGATIARNTEVGRVNAAAATLLLAALLIASPAVADQRDTGPPAAPAQASDNSRAETALARRARQVASEAAARRGAGSAADTGASARGGGGAVGGRSSDSPPAPPRLPGIPFPAVDPQDDDRAEFDLFADPPAPPGRPALPAVDSSSAADPPADRDPDQPARTSEADADAGPADSADATRPHEPERDPAHQAPAQPAEPTPRTYTIRSGDTFSALAVRFYGQERKWKLIAEANPDADPQRLAVGQEIRLPDAAAPASDHGRRVDAARPARTDRPPAEQADHDGRTITVESGDTLSHIAQRVYGSARLWDKLLEANRDQLDDPTDLKAGMTLRLPDLSNHTD